MTDWEDDSGFVSAYVCPVCGTEDCVPATGNPDSKILVVGEFPGKEEIKEGKPLVGATGGVFRAEMRRLGYDVAMFRICNLWHHEQLQPKDKNYKDCLQQGLSQVIKEAKGKRAILLLGSECTKVFCNCNVRDVNGLQVKSVYLSAPLIVASYNPAYVFNQGVGELRLALGNFVKLYEQMMKPENIIKELGY